MTADYSKVRALGPWVCIRKVDPGDPYSLEALGSGLYFSSGTGEQRVSHGRGLVISAGSGCTVTKELAQRVKGYEEGVFVPMDPDIVPGVVVSYRGYLEGANQVHQWESQDYCFIHMDSIHGVWEGIELEEMDGKLVEKLPVKGWAGYEILEPGTLYKIGEVQEFKETEPRKDMPVFMGVDLAKK